MSTILSNRVQKIKPSATLTVSDKAKQLKAQGVQIISMGSGEPDFDTPVNIQKAATQAIGCWRDSLHRSRWNTATQKSHL